MKFMLSLLAFGYVALASAAPSLPVNPGGIGGLFKGPNSETIIKGPDGSVITAAAEGGEVVSNVEPIVVAEPVLVQETAPVVEAVAVPPAAVDSKLSSDLIGPSGRIATQGSSSIVAGPASTTVTGPAVVAETLVKGPPIVAPALSLTPPAVPLATVSVTASPIATVSALPINADLGGSGLVSLGASIPESLLLNANLGGPIATVTEIPPVAVTAAPQAVATVSVSPELSVATATALNGAVATASTTSNQGTAFVETGALPTVTARPLPGVPPTVISGIGGLDTSGLVGINNGIDLRPQRLPGIDDRVDLGLQLVPGFNDRSGLRPQVVPGNNDRTDLRPQLVPEINDRSDLKPQIVPGIIDRSDLRPQLVPGINGRTNLGTQLIPGTNLRPQLVPGVNDRTDLRPQLIPDQVAIDNRQLNINPALIPATNIIPPEIAVTPRIPVGRLRPTPGTLLTTPGLSAVGNSPNIQREEETIIPNVTPNILQANPQVTLTPQQVLQLQNQQSWLTNQIQNTQPVSATTLGVTPSTLQVTPDQLLSLQNQRNLLNPQIQQGGGQEVLSPNQLQNPEVPRALFTPNIEQTTRINPSLANIQQDILASELAKSGIDASQLQLTNVPLSSVSALAPPSLNKVGINDGLAIEGWGRYGRDAENKEKVTKKTKKDN